ncbi:50S ribosome-binding GTPase [Streptomyces sp. 3211.6]|uniref:GTPase n=1 Tax=Streptomyces sp. 3211.6 TaxID=1938845 RepID=UPI000C2C900E|nr:GTPase [Streptomyces sp. 3211.6]RKT04765.1 50S ribosome-binding GTPase [Streptomyces sp. 3211.6]
MTALTDRDRDRAGDRDHVRDQAGDGVRLRDRAGDRDRAGARDRSAGTGADPERTDGRTGDRAAERAADRWDDGFIARSRSRTTRKGGFGRARSGGAEDELAAEGLDEEADAGEEALVRAVSGAGSDGGKAPAPPLSPEAQALRSRLDALRQLVGLSRTRLDGKTLAEAGRVLDEAAARRGLSAQHTVVAVAGATGSGKSTLFNALAGVQISETGLRRPTTAAPIACSWSDGAAGLLDRLEIPGRLRRRPRETPEAEALRGMVLVDLPDLDSALGVHREHVDRVLALVDAVIWVVDPEKYADAVLHERYLRPLAGHAEVTFVVLNQVDRLPGEAADLVLDDLRRLLDEDGIALGEHGEPGATVLGLSALTGEGVGELRELLGQFTQEKGAATRRIAADVDRAATRLRPLYVADRHNGPSGPEIGEAARAEFEDRLAEAVGAYAAGLAAERAWRRNAGKACGTPWLRLWRWYESRRAPRSLAGLSALAVIGRSTTPAAAMPAEEEVTARQRVEQAVRTVADEAAVGLPEPWAQAVRETAVRGAALLPEALDELAVTLGAAVPAPGAKPPRPAWWPAAVLAQAAMTLVQIFGGLWLVGQIAGVLEPKLLPPVLFMVAGIVGGPLVEWACSMAARGPARRYGQDAERRLRQAAAGCGRARVLEPVAAELLRYREVREQYAAVSAGGTRLSTTRH